MQVKLKIGTMEEAGNQLVQTLLMFISLDLHTVSITPYQELNSKVYTMVIIIE